MYVATSRQSNGMSSPHLVTAELGPWLADIIDTPNIIFTAGSALSDVYVQCCYISGVIENCVVIKETELTKEAT